MTINPDLQRVINATSAILLDFDGPVTHLFIDGRNRMVADRMRAALPAGVDIPSDLRDTPDPLVILRWSSHRLPPAEAARVERACEAGELTATLASHLTSGCAELLQAASVTSTPVVIVSNNTDTAIRAFLDQHHLSSKVSAVVARVSGRPDLMKPHPASVERALAHLRLPPGACAFIGDSVTDIEVSLATGVRPIGFAKSPARGVELANAGAIALADSMEEVAWALIASTGPAAAARSHGA